MFLGDVSFAHMLRVHIVSFVSLGMCVGNDVFVYVYVRGRESIKQRVCVFDREKLIHH